MERLEDQLGIPLPAATQWEIEEELAEVINPARDQLIRQTAQGEVRLPDRVAASHARAGGQPAGLDALELPRDAGARRGMISLPGRKGSSAGMVE